MLLINKPSSIKAELYSSQVTHHKLPSEITKTVTNLLAPMVFKGTKFQLSLPYNINPKMLMCSKNQLGLDPW